METSKQQPKILIVDDTPENVDVLSEILKPLYRRSVALNGEKALRLSRSGEPPDLILLDIMMPGMDGYEVCQKLKADPKTSKIPIIFVTAKSEVEDETRGLELGAVDYITKPVSPPIVLARIKTHLELKTARDFLEDQNRILEQKNETIAKAHKLLAKYVPPQLTERILADEIDDVWDYSRRRLTMFFSDIKDFTATTEQMEPEDMANLLNAYLSEMYEIANEFGGVVANVKGDELFIFFGAPEKRPDRENALRCVKMAVAMQRRMSELNEKWYNEGISRSLRIRCGINTGMVNVGGFGSRNRRDYTAFGMHVNLASRLEGICDPGGILVSHATWAMVKEDFQFETRGEVTLKGFSQAMLAHNLVM